MGYTLWRNLMIQHLLKSVHTKNKNVLKLSFSFIYFLLFYSIAHGQVPNLDEGKFHLQIHENEQKTNTKLR